MGIANSRRRRRSVAPRRRAPYRQRRSVIQKVRPGSQPYSNMPPNHYYGNQYMRGSPYYGSPMSGYGQNQYTAFNMGNNYGYSPFNQYTGNYNMPDPFMHGPQYEPLEYQRMAMPPPMPIQMPPSYARAPYAANVPLQAAAPAANVPIINEVGVSGVRTVGLANRGMLGGITDWTGGGKISPGFLGPPI